MMEISFGLSTKEIARVKKELIAYRNDLIRKCELFVEKLAYRGIATATMNTGEYGDLITFSKEITAVGKGTVTGIMLATSGTIKRQWLANGNVREADVSPLLMAEYGSGWKASDAAGMPNAAQATLVGAGQGTFPGQTHAFDKKGWYWQDLDGKWHHSRGEEPTMPMFKAAMEMEMDIFDIAKEVFG